MRVFLDSCVILSRLPRELLFDAARSGLIEIFFSQSVEEETRHVAKRKGFEADIGAAFIDLALFGTRVQGEEYDGLWLPDDNDRHVVFGALAAKAEIIVTENLRDFPKAALMPLGLLARNPDQLLYPFVLHNKLKINNYDTNALKSSKLYKLAKLSKNELNHEG